MENHSPDEVLAGSFTASLASSYGEATNYRAVAHPSVPNYLVLTSGSTWGVADDSFHALPAQDIGHQLTRAGVAWRAYMEGLGSGLQLCSSWHMSVSVGDAWLSGTVGTIMQSKAWSANGVLFIVWDEDDGSSDNHVLSLVVTPNQGHRTRGRLYTHYSLLATVEDLLGVGRLGKAAGAPAMTDLVAP